MKKILSVSLACASLFAVSACSNNAKQEEAAVETATSNMPAECQTYMEAIDKLVAKSPDAAKQFQEALEASKSQWENLSDEQAEEANKACKQMMDQIAPMLN